MIMLVVRSTRGSLLPETLGTVDQQRFASDARTSRVFVNTKEKMSGPKKEEKRERTASQPMLITEIRERLEKGFKDERIPALLSSTMRAG